MLFWKTFYLGVSINYTDIYDNTCFDLSIIRPYDDIINHCNSDNIITVEDTIKGKLIVAYKKLEDAEYVIDKITQWKNFWENYYSTKTTKEIIQTFNI